jgi:hypothetical protein
MCAFDAILPASRAFHTPSPERMSCPQDPGTVTRMALRSSEHSSFEGGDDGR